MYPIKTKTVSSLEKVLPKMDFCAPEIHSGVCLKNERFSYQIAYIGDASVACGKRFVIQIDSPLAEKIKVYEVQNVPVTQNGFPHAFDNGFLTREPALLPDVLAETDGTVTVSPLAYKALWISASIDEGVEAGEYAIQIRFLDDVSGEILGESLFSLRVKHSVLPKQQLKFTQWLHCDCISSYYEQEPLSESHWAYIESFVRTAAENGVNMLLTPIFTPALDTKIGCERPTVQLLDIAYDNGTYTFGFEKLSRWLDMCKRVGIEYLEIAHLYSQWGAEKTPKIVVTENGKPVKKFGWHTESQSEEYKAFLAAMLPALGAFLKENWDCRKVYFHISDEPHAEHIERYGELYRFIKPYIKDFNLMDAISDYEIYQKGYIDTPVSTTRTIHNFIDRKTENLWAYYCCGEGSENLSNRFIAMPSYRNRVLGAQLFKYNIKGFLHWGYNFYYSQYSVKLINPYLITDADGAFPSGDSFSVYPGRHGAVPSLRLFVFYEALQDMRAMELAAQKVGREAVVALIDRCGEITFNAYPDSAAYILNLRRAVNDLLD